MYPFTVLTQLHMIERIFLEKLLSFVKDIIFLIGEGVPIHTVVIQLLEEHLLPLSFYHTYDYCVIIKIISFSVVNLCGVFLSQCIILQKLRENFNIFPTKPVIDVLDQKSEVYLHGLSLLRL